MAHHHHAADSNHDTADLIALLDLDAAVLHDYLAEVTTWVASLAPEPCERVVDLGSGSGSGSVGFARLLPDAEVVALDRSADLLAHARAQAQAAGVGDRFRALEVDVDEGWPDTGPVDLVWASMSLHHVADPERTLADIMGALRPGGVLAVVEIDGQPQFLPDELGMGRPGLEARCRRALAGENTEQVPHLGSDWDARFAAASLPVIARRAFDIDLQPPLPSATGRYARAYLARIRRSLDGRLDADDLAVLDRLLDDRGPDSVLRRNDLTVRTVRTAWVARRR